MKSVDVLVLRSAGIPTAVVGLVATVVATVAVGSTGLVAGLLGTAIVLAFFSVGQLVLGRVLRDNPQAAMTVAMTLYLVKVGLLFGFLVLFHSTTLFDARAFGLTIVACTLTWTVAEVWVFARTKVLYVQPGSGPGRPGGDADRAGPATSPPTGPAAPGQAGPAAPGPADPAARQGDRP